MYNNRKISMIVATDRAGGIGYKNKLPWAKIPEDMKWFKKKTEGNIVIMGRRTAESIGKLLPNRYNIIIASSVPRDIVDNSPLHEPYNYCVYRDFENALYAMTIFPSKQKKEIFIIGGAQLYKTAMDMDIVDVIYKTVINQTCQTDTSFLGPKTLENWKVTTLMFNDKMYRVKYERLNGDK